MRIAVIGAGAMGSIFAVNFDRGGHEVILVDVAVPLVEHINAEGVTIVREGDETTTRITATSEPSFVGPVDLVVFCVKCYHTEPAVEMARPLIGPDTIVASLQNGWGNGDVIARVFDPDRIVVGVTYNSGTVLGLGRVAYPGVGPTTVGPFADGPGNGPERLAAALQDGGLEVVVARPVRPEIWKKLILNAASLPEAALTGMSAGDLTGNPDTHDLITQAALEATQVANALGYEIDSGAHVEFIHGLAARAGASKASMLQDFEAGRRTEIDVINGAVVKSADELGVPVPLNRALMQLVRGWESHRGLR